jgi:hypothetical protein
MTFIQKSVFEAGRVKEVAQLSEVVVNVALTAWLPQSNTFTMASLLQLWSKVVTTITCVWWYVIVDDEDEFDDPEIP